MKEKIYEIIKVQSNNITFKNISKRLNISSDELHKHLQALKLEGKILQVGNKYRLFPEELNIGTVIETSGGKKYLYHDDKKISISSDFFNNIILNDVVSFSINENNEAEIYTIIDRKLGKMTCEVILDNGKKKIVPYHEGITITLPSEITDNLYDGDIILVDTTPNDLDDYSDAKFIRKLGNKSDPLPKDTEIALNYEFDNDYSEEYLKEIETYPKKVSEEDIIDRQDYRYQHCFTIDGMNTKDMDDGVYGEILRNGNIRVYVHIADVSHYIKPNSLVFKRACEKGTSLYMNNSVFHMLHQTISNGICSLNQGDDRLTKTIIMDIDPNGNITDFNITKSVINSKKKMTYEEVDEIFLEDNIPSGYETFMKDLYILSEASNRLERRYTEDNGKIDFCNDELHITYNSDGSIKEIESPEFSQSRKIIENLMIAANETVAGWFYNMSIPTVYRVHEFPNVYKINHIIDECNKSGYKIRHINNVDSPKIIQKLLDKLKDNEGYSIISSLLVSSMQRARYDTENLGHYALGLDAYLHFTSPIRRLPDLLVHMMTDLVLEHYEKLTPEYLSEYETILKELSIHASRMERQADVAEAAAERRLIIEKLATTDEEIEATICETNNNIRIKLLGIDTYINKSSLSNDFEYDPKKKLFYEKHTGTYLKMGTKVLVKITNTNTANQSFNLMVLGTINNNDKKKVLKKTS